MNDCGTCTFWCPKDTDEDIWICANLFSLKHLKQTFEDEPACGMWRDWNKP